MTALTNNMNIILGVLMVLAFVVNIIVQITKELIPLPTKAWAIIVSLIVTISSTYIASSYKMFDFTISNIILSSVGSFIVAYIAMYGFDTFKELWERFRDGESNGG